MTRRHGIRLGPRVAGAAFAGLLAAVPLASAEETHLVVPGHVELEPIPTALRLVLDWQRYGGPLDAYADRDLDPAGAAFVQLMTALRDGDAAAAARWIEPPDGASVAEVVAFWGKAFGGFGETAVLGRADIGPATLFLWSMPTERGPLVRAFVLQPVGDGFRAEIVGSDRPILNLIQHAAGHAQSGAAGWQPMPLDGEPFRIDLPVRDLEATVPLVFHGRLFDAERPGEAPEGEVLAFYDRARALLAGREVEAFVALHTPGSAAKLHEWLEGMTEEQRRLYPETAAEVRREVVLVMDAEPLHLVFFADHPPGGTAPRGLRYDTILRDAETRELRLTNFFYASHLDTLFSGRGPFPSTPEALDRALRPAR